MVREQEKAYKSTEFCNFARMLAKNNPKMAILVDKASIHTSQYTRGVLRELGVKLLLNLPYTPTLAPIKKVFMVLKNYKKRKRLQILVNNVLHNFDPKLLVRQVV